MFQISSNLASGLWISPFSSQGPDISEGFHFCCRTARVSSWIPDLTPTNHAWGRLKKPFSQSHRLLDAARKSRRCARTSTDYATSCFLLTYS